MINGNTHDYSDGKIFLLSPEVETRLAHSNTRIAEIAEELKFTDESYLSRLFKKQGSITLGAYRKLML